MPSRNWYIVTTKRLHCGRCQKWVTISNTVPSGSTNPNDLDQGDQQWIEHHCSVCGDGDDLCDCVEPRGCSAVNYGMFAEDSDSIPF